MAKKQLVQIGAAYTPINASVFSTYVEIQEDGSGSASGLKVKFPGDNNVYEYPVSAQPIKLGVPPLSGGAGHAPLLGVPAQTGSVNNPNAATVYCQIASMGANTVVRVDERP